MVWQRTKCRHIPVVLLSAIAAVDSGCALFIVNGNQTLHISPPRLDHKKYRLLKNRTMEQYDSHSNVAPQKLRRRHVLLR